MREPILQSTQSLTIAAPPTAHSLADSAWQGLLATTGLLANQSGSMSTAALEGFVTEFYAQATQRLNGDRLMATVRDLSTDDHLAQLQGGLSGGMVAGFVSPVTDLLGLGVLAEQLPMIAGSLARRAWPGSSDLINEAENLERDFTAFKTEARTKLRQILQDPAQLAMIAAKIGPEATKAAHSAGREAARTIVGLFEGAPEREQKPPSSLSDSLTRMKDGDLSGVLSLVTSRATNVREYIFRAPWAQTGYSIGHTVGAVVSNLLLLVFSDGVGNALAKIGAWVGELAPLLARGAEGLAALGRGIATVETLIGQIISKGVSAIKPLEALLTPLFRLLQRFQGFARRLFGVAEHGAAKAAVKGAATVADEALAKGASDAIPSAQGKVVSFKRTVSPQRSPLSRAQDAALGKVPKGSREISRIGPNPVGPHPEAVAAAQPAEHALENAVAEPVQLKATGTGDPFGTTVAAGPKGPKQPTKPAVKPAAKITAKPAAPTKPVTEASMTAARRRANIDALADNPELQATVATSAQKAGLRDLAEHPPEALKLVWKNYQANAAGRIAAGKQPHTFDKYVTMTQASERRAVLGEMTVAFDRKGKEIMVQAPGVVNEKGIDIITYKPGAGGGRIKLIDNKAWRRNVNKVSALEENLPQNLSDSVAMLRDAAQLPGAPPELAKVVLPRLQAADKAVNAHVNAWSAANPGKLLTDPKLQIQLGKILDQYGIDRVITTEAGKAGVGITSTLGKRGSVHE